MKQLTPTQKGALTGILMIAAALFSFYVLKVPAESNFQLILYLIFSLGIVWSLIDYAKSNAEDKVFKDYFSIGFKTFVVVALLMAVFTYIFFSFNTSFRDSNIAENSRMLMLQGNHTPAEIEENAAKLKKMFMPIMVSATIFRYLIVGSLVTAITAGYLIRKK